MMENSEQTIFEPIGKSERFSFRCHPGIACFNHCCSKLKLVLTPYDIVKMKNILNMDSESFLDRYTQTFFDNRSRFPGVRLKMLENEEKSCPFVTPEGCRIYRARPGACRLYPIGRATAYQHTDLPKTPEKYFLVRETHCLGFNEARSWNPTEWMSHEGLKSYLAMNDPWQRIIATVADPGQGENAEQKKRMFFMASYNLDHFRGFLFESSFFNRFYLDDTNKNKIYENDEDLIIFAIDWLKFCLMGEQSSFIKV